MPTPLRPQLQPTPVNCVAMLFYLQAVANSALCVQLALASLRPGSAGV